MSQIKSKPCPNSLPPHVPSPLFDTPKIILIGYGKMGSLIHSLASQEGTPICAIVDPFYAKETKHNTFHPNTAATTRATTRANNTGMTDSTEATDKIPVFAKLDAALTYLCDKPATNSDDSGTKKKPASPPTQTKIKNEKIVAIDFAHAKQLKTRVELLANYGLDIIIGTTGSDLSDDWLSAIAQERHIGILRASNFSIGVYLHTRLAEYSAQLIRSFNTYDVSLTESHHIEKKDRPSGTALSLAQAILKNYAPHKGRVDNNLPSDSAPQKDTLYINSQRIGTEIGTHLIDYDSPYDRISINHSAKNRKGFASGALMAAHYIIKHEGLHSIEQLFDSIQKETT